MEIPYSWFMLVFWVDKPPVTWGLEDWKMISYCFPLPQCCEHIQWKNIDAEMRWVSLEVGDFQDLCELGGN